MLRHYAFSLLQPQAVQWLLVMVQALVQRLVLERGLELAVQPQLISVPPQ